MPFGEDVELFLYFAVGCRWGEAEGFIMICGIFSIFRGGREGTYSGWMGSLGVEEAYWWVPK